MRDDRLCRYEPNRAELSRAELYDYQKRQVDSGKKMEAEEKKKRDELCVNDKMCIERGLILEDAQDVFVEVVGVYRGCGDGWMSM